MDLYFTNYICIWFNILLYFFINSCIKIKSHSAVVYKRKILIFGGFAENFNKHFNELYEFNIGKKFYICSTYVCVYSSFFIIYIIFLYKDTSEWNICSGIRGVAPSPRRRHSCCIVDDRMFIFGGTG